MTQPYAFGQAVSRVEDPRLLRGRGQYAADVTLPGQAFAHFVRSPHAHARVKALNVDAARQAPGILAVLTHADVSTAGLGLLPSDGTRKRLDGSAAHQTARPLLVQERARHVGEPVAMIVAESLAQAIDAAELVDIDYEPLPAVVGAVNAARPDAVKVWDEVPDNLAFFWSAGDRATVERVLPEAHHVTRLNYVVTRVMANPIEPRSALGLYDEREDRFTLWSAVQMPFSLRNVLAERIFKLPSHKFRLLTCDIGGSFGMKNGVYPEQPLVLWASRQVGRPVKWVADRNETMMTDEQGRDHVVTASLGLDRDGKFLGLMMSGLLGIGAYLTPRSAGPTGNAGGIAGVYTTPYIYAEVLGVHTHCVPTGPYRGAGRPEATFCIERLIDTAAREMGIDPVALRRRNMIPTAAMPYKTGLTFTYDSGDFAAVMDKALALADYGGVPARRAAARDNGRLWGVGIAYPIEVAGGPYVQPSPDSAQIAIWPDGSAIVTP
ncbi:MAG: xanthine dehydrogenase family protein molybdopterin-binding subunit, partial [Alphaproteobacteria bacterium]|nr:xanthine dehydrogenase family protein molybdopterin-binding subunit [Alphaproteobacteria bacterium]